MAKRKLTDKEKELMRTPAGWCRGVVEDRRDAMFYPEQEADINILKSNTLIYGKRKSRRCGWSHGLTRGAVAIAHLMPISIYIVSLNLADAFKKISECYSFYQKVHPDARIPLVEHNKQSLKFQHPNGDYSEIVATFHPRGMPGRNLIIIIDEADHILDLQFTLNAALPNIVQGNSKIIIGGSVCRDHGPFNDMFKLDLGSAFGDDVADRLKKHIKLSELFWWQVPWLLSPEARRNHTRVREQAPAMNTLDRVRAFGSDRLKLTFAMLPLESFQQEYELVAMQDGDALIPWEFILKCSSDPKHAFFTDIFDLTLWANSNGYTLIAGYDVGYRSNTSELTIFGYDKDKDFAIEGYRETFSRKKLPDQEKYLREILYQVPGMILAIDAGGPGAQMAESLKSNFKRRVIPVELEFYKRLGVLDSYANRFYKGKIKLVADVDRRMQVYSIKKRTGESGRVLYYVPRKEKHHADVAISQALATHVVDEMPGTIEFELHSGRGITVEHMDLGEISGGHDDFLRDVVNG